MKKEITLFLLLTFLILPIAIAEPNLSNPKSQILNPNSASASESLSTIGVGLDTKTENILEKEIKIPDQLQFPMRLIFGIKKDTPITIERFAVLFAAWMMFFIIIQGVLKITPILNKGIPNIAGSVIITILIALTGTINVLVIFFFELGDTFEWMAALGPFQLLVALAIAAIIIAIGHYITHIIETKYLLAKAEYVGENVGVMAKMAEITSKNVEKLSK